MPIFSISFHKTARKPFNLKKMTSEKLENDETQLKLRKRRETQL